MAHVGIFGMRLRRTTELQVILVEIVPGSPAALGEVTTGLFTSAHSE